MKDFDYIANHTTESDILCRLAVDATNLADVAMCLRRISEDSTESPVAREDYITELMYAIAALNVTATAAMRKLNISFDAVTEAESVDITRWEQTLREVSGK